MEALLDILIDFIFEFLLTGAVEAAGARKIPLAIRLVALSVLLLVYGILLYVTVKIAVEEQSFLALIAMLLILVIFIFAAVKRYRELKAEQQKTKDNQ